MIFLKSLGATGFEGGYNKQLYSMIFLKSLEATGL